MTYNVRIELSNGDIKEVKTNPGCAPMVFINGVLQEPGGNPFKWVKWFAWRPVKVNDKWTWLKMVYRRERIKGYVNHDDWTQYEYGTIFNVLKD